MPTAFQQTLRSIPLPIVLQIAFNNVLSMIGWIFFGVGMILFLLIGLDSNLFTFHRFMGELEKVEGKVLKTSYTDWSIDEESVVRWIYTFDYQGKKYLGTSYAVDMTALPDQSVIVEFAANSPEYSRIEGFNEALIPWWITIIVMIFPMLGLLFIYLSVRHLPKTIGLLRSGTLAYASYVDKESTDMIVNNMPVYKLRFQFEDDRGNTHYAFAQSHLIDDLTDNPQKAVIYHPQEPEKALLLDELPGRPYLNEEGRWQCREQGYLYLLPAAIAVIVSAIIAFFKFS
jgi:hypothetical protein